jgi:NAD(P)H-dependent FMN reductase
MVTVRLLTICGSLGPGSANRSALDVVEAEARAAGAEVHTDAALADIPPFRPDLVDTPPASVAEFRRQITDAHVVVIASPEYAGGIAGTLKNALDWVVGSGDLYGKPVGALAAGSTGGTHALAQLALTLGYQGAQVVAQLGIAAPKVKVDAEGRYTDPDTLDALRTFTAEVLQATSVA